MDNMNLVEALKNLWTTSGFAAISGQELIMIGVACLLIYLAIAKQFEPMLLLPIAFGMLLTNLPITGINNPPVQEFVNGTLKTTTPGGLFYYIYKGVEYDIYPPLIFLGVGAMTDFGPLLANPSSILMGAGAQFGVFFTFICALLLGFTPQEASSIGIVGGADGPTAIYLSSKLAPHLLGPIAVAAYSYMALVPLIQPPIMKALTTKKERTVRMGQLRRVRKVEKIVFPIVVTIVVTLLLPSIAPLIGMLMLGNLFREAAVVDRLSDTAQNALINIITIFLGTTVGATAKADIFLRPDTLKIIALGVVAFGISTAAGVLIGKIMYKVTGGKVNPLIGSAGVSAVPMAARVSQVVGQKEDPSNFLLMHAMGPNVAGVIGTAVAAGVLLSLFG
jgi:carboxybiotin decarboxylase